mmetsp:Transcript_25871/g.22798  ORF Transcript_25871/g.22798 Transcript_25871/m.22798 type:complete len:113 (+) Transcript_25871:64-402(+)|eukprot:CAMPEP_0114589804 /NCGR_PEP_ID=MMETSP0125-20121206/12173_1 /TAXON_ID=485358 ORGANISM="Aristerostoma sp., Strain ATCC 50986" /NCGR_SAMPLE_ID=MMETSP0125 /ASSEMBLY_ACC=CAM_ASM_000245 /LENGTH=112 /DNA_ID=CAMNT_0001786899 /DNA_START=53 /DNA_END=391 /DNA_ORIENTATION=-
MKYIAAYALVVLSGNTSPSEDDVKKVLSEAGCEVNGEEVTKTVAALKGKQLHECIESGTKKMSSLSFGAPAGGAGSAPAKQEAKQEAKKEEKVEEEEVNLGGGGLFGDDDEW